MEEGGDDRTIRSEPDNSGGTGLCFPDTGKLKHEKLRDKNKMVNFAEIFDLTIKGRGKVYGIQYQSKEYDPRGAQV